MKQFKKRIFTLNNDVNNKATIITIIFLSSLFVLAVFSSVEGHTIINALSQLKDKAPSLSTNHRSIQKDSKSQILLPINKESIGAESQSFATVKNNSAEALTIAHHLQITSINASDTQARLGSPCIPELSKFIKPQKESRFTIIKQCVTVTGKVSWTHYFNEDGDANFNVILDSPYKDMLGPGNYGQAFALKYGVTALHVEVVCQGPVTSVSPENIGACNGYNGPDFKHVLPKIGEHVMVTGRYLVEMPEMPGGITELHPAYDIKIIHSKG